MLIIQLLPRIKFWNYIFGEKCLSETLSATWEKFLSETWVPLAKFWSTKITPKFLEEELKEVNFIVSLVRRKQKRWQLKKKQHLIPQHMSSLHLIPEYMFTNTWSQNTCLPYIWFFNICSQALDHQLHDLPTLDPPINVHQHMSPNYMTSIPLII